MGRETRRAACVLVLGCLAAGCGGPARSHPPKAAQQPMAGASAPLPEEVRETARLRALLVDGHATFDGAVITDLKPVGRCAASLITGRGATTVHWAEMGNSAPHTYGAKEAFNLPAGGQPHEVLTRAGETGTSVYTQLLGLDMDCGGV